MLQQEIIVEPKIYLNKLCLTIVHLFVTPTTKKWNKLAIYIMTIIKITKDVVKSCVDVDNLKWWPKKYDV